MMVELLLPKLTNMLEHSTVSIKLILIPTYPGLGKLQSSLVLWNLQQLHHSPLIWSKSSQLPDEISGKLCALVEFLQPKHIPVEGSGTLIAHCTLCWKFCSKNLTKSRKAYLRLGCGTSLPAQGSWWPWTLYPGQRLSRIGQASENSNMTSMTTSEMRLSRTWHHRPKRSTNLCEFIYQMLIGWNVETEHRPWYIIQLRSLGHSLQLHDKKWRND